MPQEAIIIEFDGDTDDYGDDLHGWYWCVIDDAGMPTSSPMGPYDSGPEAEAACRRAFERGDY